MTVNNNTAMLDTHPNLHNTVDTQLATLLADVGALFTALGDLSVKVGPDPGGAYADATSRFDTMDFSRIFHGVGFVSHGVNVGTARPTDGYGMYIWLGTVVPTNMANGDIYIDLAP